MSFTAQLCLGNFFSFFYHAEQEELENDHLLHQPRLLASRSASFDVDSCHIIFFAPSASGPLELSLLRRVHGVRGESSIRRLGASAPARLPVMDVVETIVATTQKGRSAWKRNVQIDVCQLSTSIEFCKFQRRLDRLLNWIEGTTHSAKVLETQGLSERTTSGL